MMIRLLVLTALTMMRATAADSSALRFDFSGGQPARGITAISPGTMYSETQGYGFEPGARVVAGGNCIGSDRPFVFWV
jgi:hypothetical protein